MSDVEPRDLARVRPPEGDHPSTKQGPSASGPDTAELVRSMYDVFFARPPTGAEQQHWVRKLGPESWPLEKMFQAFLTSSEFSNTRRNRPTYPPWHFYSPIVDTSTLPAGFNADPDISADGVPDVDLSLPAMDEFFLRLRPFIAGTSFTSDPSAVARYYANNPIYGLGDAIILNAMLRLLRPRRIIEVGSGHSTACMLDTVSDAALKCRITCIEPYPTRLKANLRPGDLDVLTIHEAPVQSIDAAVFDELGRDDILFIDSTHVMKTGSDVCHEMFSVLPHLAPGVMVHFHDVFYPFEYPHGWIFDRKYSWNEIYGLRALLSYSTRYKVRHFNHYYWLKRRERVEEAFGGPVPNAGGGIWIEVVG